MMTFSKPQPHCTTFHNPNPPPLDSIFTLSIGSSRKIRRDVLLSISGSIIPQVLFFLDGNCFSSANAVDIFNFVAPQPEPERTVEIAKEGLRKSAETIKETKEMMIENKRWKEGGKEIRRSASNMKQDMYLIIQAKPPKDRPLLRSLYSSLFNTITKQETKMLRRCWSTIIVWMQSSMIFSLEFNSSLYVSLCNCHGLKLNNAMKNFSNYKRKTNC